MSGLRKWLGWIGSALAVSYLAALVAIAALLRWVGERWWATGVGLYLPRIVFGTPLPIITLALLLLGLRRLLWTQVAAGLVLLFPLMGFVLPFPTVARANAPRLRILSFNVDSGAYGYDKIATQIDALSPDVVLLQEIAGPVEPLVRALRKSYPVVDTSTQFLLASRFPVISEVEPARIPFGGKLHSPRFVKYGIDSPLGPIVVYNVHPISPRAGFYAVRGNGLRRQILSGRLFEGEGGGIMQANSGLRELQIGELAELVAAETTPVIIAGDTNLPGLSPVLHRFLSRYQDGFEKAGWGFGYTFPSRHPWMRIDRVLATDDFRFVRFEVGCPHLSDHLCVLAELERRSP